MSEYTREEILKLIEENDGPEGLDLSGKDLSGIDLSKEAIVAELEKAQERAPGETPVWYRVRTGGINLQGADLINANLQGAHLGCANLQGAILRSANLQEVCLESANLQRADLVVAILQEAFLGDADLQRADLELANLQEANLWGANLQGAILWGANLQEACLESANLQRADLELANLQGAILRNANLQGARLGGADLQEASLHYSHVERVDFFAAVSLEGAYFYNAFLDNTRMRRDQLGEAIGEELDRRYDGAKEAYLALKNNFAEIGRYRDESWAYVKERQMGKMINHPRLARKFYAKELPKNPDTWRLGWFYIRHTAKWAADWVVEWTCGYGESILKTLRAMGVALVGFAVLYRLLGAVVDANGNPSSSWLHCLLYSGGAFTTFGVDALRPANDWIRALSILESMVGIALTGLLGFVLGNRIRRA